jgi:D-glycero-D-manno-heptose 1,7-bisphosphate phosphatase
VSAEIAAAAGNLVPPASYVSAIAAGLHIPLNSRFSNGATMPSSRAAVFLDRDGVLVRDVHYLRRPSQIELLPHLERLRMLQDRYYLIVATNQSGIARNLFTEADLLEIHSELVRELASHRVLVDAFYYCPHLPSAVNEAYRKICECRKPAAGLLRRAAVDWALDLKCSYIIGDSVRDVEAGNAAGLAGAFLIGHDLKNGVNHRSVRNLAEAIEVILGGAA